MKRLVKYFGDGIVRLSGAARFNLTGGSIHNIALNPIFLAAAQADPASKVTQSLIFDAIRSELRKLDKPVNEAEFRILDVVGAKS